MNTEHTDAQAVAAPLHEPVGRPASKREKLTPGQAAMLRNERDGKSWTYGLSGRSAHGGAVWTMRTLTRRGLLTREGAGLTALGEAALLAHDKTRASARCEICRNHQAGWLTHCMDCGRPMHKTPNYLVSGSQP